MQGASSYVVRSFARWFSLLLFAASPAWAQVTINSIQASPPPATPTPLNVDGITSTAQVNALILYLNGSFPNIASSTTVTWLNTTTNASFTDVSPFATTTQVRATFPTTLFAAAVPFVQTVQVTVNQGGSIGTATFHVNPVPHPASSGTLPLGTVGTLYNAQLVADGTPPYSLVSGGGSVPGLQFSPGFDAISGNPTTIGTFPVSASVSDAWGVTTGYDYNLQVIAPATVSSVVPNSVPAGSGQIQIAVNGNNFVDPALPSGGSTVQWTVNSTTQFLTTTYISANQLTAIVPTALMAQPGIASVAVLQPNDVASPGLPFTLLNPVLNSISPTSVVTNSGPFTLTLNGANFASRVGAPDVATGPFQPQVMFGTTLLQGTIVNQGVVTVTVPGNLIATNGAKSIFVVNPGGSTTGTRTLIVDNLAIATTGLTPGTVGIPYLFHMVATGGVSPIIWDTLGIPAGLSINPQTGDISGTPQNAGTFPFTVRATDSLGQQVAANYQLVIAPPALSITSPALPSGVAGAAYVFQLTAAGGVGPYTWAAGGLPNGLTINAQTGVISGTPQSTGTSQVTIRLTDSSNASASRVYGLTIAAPPAVISTPSALPNGTVGIPYAANLDVSGPGSFTFAVTSGRLPDGLNLASGGQITGTPTRAGTFDFVVVASDPLGNSPSKPFTIVILPSPLVIANPSTTVTVGTPVNIGFTVTGGVAPYRLALDCALPAGLSFNGSTITGTPTTPGTASCHVTATDTVGTSTGRDFTITVVAQTISFPGSALPAGQVGVSYSAQVTARGGTPPITYTGSGLPDGLSISAAGLISGTPTAPGQFSFSLTATDANRGTATGTFSIAIAPAALAITTASLPDGVVGTAYSASLAASGGVPPYTWTVSGLPSGVTATTAGVLSGTPDTAGTFTVSVTVSDASRATASTRFTVRIAAPALVITTASAPGGTVGADYSASFAATGGVPPFTWSATGLPAGLTISSSGTVSGKPTTAGTSNAVVTVRDSAGTTTSKTFSIVVVLPPAPPLSYGGVTGTAPPLQQPTLTVSLGSPYPVDVIVTLTLTFTPDSGADDPAIQFSTGGRTARITIPAGSTNGATSVGVQTGTVAGVIAITSQLLATGVDITPTPAPRQTIRIAAGPPVLTQVTGVRTGTGFTVTATGFVTDREATQAVFQFNAATGTNLQTTTLTVTVDALFGSYFGSAAAGPFGGQFTLSQPFAVTGNLQGVASVTVTVVNKLGSSNTITVNLN